MATAPKTDERGAVVTVDGETGEVQSMGMDGLPAASNYGLPARVSDLIRTPDAWSEYEQRPVEECINVDLILLDCMIFDSVDYEDRRWSIILARDPETNHFLTTACGGSVLVRKLETLSTMKRPDGTIGAFPIVGRILLKPSRTKGHQDYYDLV